MEAYLGDRTSSAVCPHSTQLPVCNSQSVFMAGCDYVLHPVVCYVGSNTRHRCLRDVIGYNLPHSGHFFGISDASQTWCWQRLQNCQTVLKWNTRSANYAMARTSASDSEGSSLKSQLLAGCPNRHFQWFSSVHPSPALKTQPAISSTLLITTFAFYDVHLFILFDHYVTMLSVSQIIYCQMVR
jgi:hypothetical protein